jgi:hypothetical protein
MISTHLQQGFHMATIQRGIIIQDADIAFMDNTRIPFSEVTELQNQMNANNNDEFGEVWLQELEYHEMMSEYTEEEMYTEIDFGDYV